MIPRLGPGFHEGDRGNLDIGYEERDSLSLQLFCKPCMINVVVGGERVADFVEGDAHLLEICLHDPERSRPADVNQKARSAGADHPIVGGAVADIHDRRGGPLGHFPLCAA